MRWHPALAALLALAGCAADGTRPLAGDADLAAGEPLVDDDPGIREFVLRNASGMEVRFLDFGATITAIEVPDRNGRRANVVLGYGSESEYRAFNTRNYFGAVVGRYAGRIANARFAIEGKEVQLRPNQGPHALHGGAEPGLSFKTWRVRPFRHDGVVGAVLSLTDPEGAQGFPGALDLTVTYTLTPDDALRIDYTARTTAPTVMNLTNHSYFNLAGAGSGTVVAQQLQIEAARYAVTGPGDIPTGALSPVAGTPLDFRKAYAIGERISVGSPLIAQARGGYNHAWVFDKPPGRFAPVVRLADPASGRTLRIETTEPSLQAYTGEYFSGEDRSPSGRAIRPRDGIALETQHLSDSPNRPEFPSTVLRPGETWRSTTVWRFGTDG